MTLKQLYGWLAPRFDRPECVRLGSVDGSKPYFLGIFDDREEKAEGRAKVCLGGAECTHWDVMTARLLLRWGQSQPEAEAAAQKLWAMFYGQTGLTMVGALVFWTDPGAGPVPLGKGGDGVFEYLIRVQLYYGR